MRPAERRKHPVGVDPRREARQTRAQERQAVYESLSLDEKLARIESRRGESKKERARLSG